VVEVMALLRVVERARDVDPDRAVPLAEVRCEVWPRHQVEPGEVHGAVAKLGAGAESRGRSPACGSGARPELEARGLPVAGDAQGRRPARTDAELPRDAVGRLAPGADTAAVDASQMMPGADGDAVLARIVAAARAENDVVVVQLPAAAARRHRTSPTIT